ncbi:MAG: tetratricopeptide repeat protein [Saprospiraceae bacterium]|nr:tetratricopeptide repeat protein [Saprospiraceae bacterium]MBL0023983.1 tetratricopeptide repeat protein [Saprospiraceae bacterium]
MRTLFIIFVTCFLTNNLDAQISFCVDKNYPLISFSAETKQKLEVELKKAESDYTASKGSLESTIWYGRRLAYLGRYNESIEIYSIGILRFPNDARLHRHRGHRYLTLRCVDKAIEDFKVAVTLIKDRKDEIEPDGMPNAANIPTSTLQSNIWYHLGLAYYLKKDFRNAEYAYKQCLKVSTNPDMYVATANWYYITLKELKEESQAELLLNTVSQDLLLIENEAYLDILMLYKNHDNADRLWNDLKKDSNVLMNATTGFGLGNYYRLIGDHSKAKEIFRDVTSGSQWGSFAFMAAELWQVSD